MKEKVTEIGAKLNLMQKMAHHRHSSVILLCYSKKSFLFSKLKNKMIFVCPAEPLLNSFQVFLRSNVQCLHVLRLSRVNASYCVTCIFETYERVSASIKSTLLSFDDMCGGLVNIFRIDCKDIIIISSYQLDFKSRCIF